MAFAGLTFVIVGETSAPRDELEKKIKDAEGTVSKTAKKSVTHLVCGSGAEETANYEKLSKNSDIHIVSEKFIADSLKKKKKQSEANYTYSPSENKDENDEAASEEEEASVEEKAPAAKKQGGKGKASESVPEEDLAEEQEVEVTPAKKGRARRTSKEDETDAEEKKEDKKKAPKAKKAKEAGSAESSQQPKRVLKSDALKNMVVVINGKFSMEREKFVDWIEENGGHVLPTLNSKTDRPITHVISSSDQDNKVHRQAKEMGVPVVPEEYVTDLVAEAKKTAKSVQSPKKGAKIVKILRSKTTKGEVLYVVKYEGFDAPTEVPRETVVKHLGLKAVDKFDHDRERQMNSVFGFSNDKDHNDEPSYTKDKEAKAKKTNTNAAPAGSKKRKRDESDDEVEEVAPVSKRAKTAQSPQKSAAATSKSQKKSDSPAKNQSPAKKPAAAKIQAASPKKTANKAAKSKASPKKAETPKKVVKASPKKAATPKKESPKKENTPKKATPKRKPAKQAPASAEKKFPRRTAGSASPKKASPSKTKAKPAARGRAKK